MIGTELNDRLTRVEPGTPGGRFHRMYWHPIAIQSSLEREPVQRVRVLGENLVLFKDGSGAVGLLPERCPHRGASLGYGFPEPNGIRCPYHGWLFSPDGACLEQPNQVKDSPRFREQCGVRSYKVQCLGGMVFAYLGPDPAPELPTWDLFTWEDTPTRFRDIGWAIVPCNWMQIVENNMDPTHTEWLHGRLFDYHLTKSGAEPSPVLSGHHVKVGFDPFEYGIIKRRMREGQTEQDDDWRVGHPMVFPSMVKVGGKGLSSFLMRTPIDDENTLHFFYSWYEVPEGFEDVAEAVKAFNEDHQVRVLTPDGGFSVEHIDAQDVMVCASQGPRTDRQGEHLCEGDRGVVMFRRLLRQQIDACEEGDDPMNVFRAPLEGPLDLPLEDKDMGLGGDAGNPLAAMLRFHGVESERLTTAVRLLDERLGIRRDREILTA